MVPVFAWGYVWLVLVWRPHLPAKVSSSSFLPSFFVDDRLSQLSFIPFRQIAVASVDCWVWWWQFDEEKELLVVGWLLLFLFLSWRNNDNNGGGGCFQG